MKPRRAALLFWILAAILDPRFAEAACQTPSDVPENAAARRAWCKYEAERKGSDHAYYRLGLDYIHGGDGIPADARKALAMLEIVAKRGYCPAYAKIAEVYLGDHYGERQFPDNLAKAVEWHEAGAKLGVTESFIWLMLYHRLGRYRDMSTLRYIDLPEAIKWTLAGEKYGMTASGYYISEMVEQGATREDILEGRRRANTWLKENPVPRDRDRKCQ